MIEKSPNSEIGNDVNNGQQNQESLYREIDRLVSQHKDELVEIRHQIHANPELSNREEKTSALVAQHLRSLGLDEVRTGIAGHGVVGVLHGGLPGDRVIALRADMDALPVRETSGVEFASTVIDTTYPGGPFPVAHAYGHDCHTATVLTTATVLSAVREQLPGTVLFVFQPAEKGPPIDDYRCTGTRLHAMDGSRPDARGSRHYQRDWSVVPAGSSVQPRHGYDRAC